MNQTSVKTSYTSLFLDYFGDFLGSPEPSGLVKNQVQLRFLFYDSLTSCKKSEKRDTHISEILRWDQTNWQADEQANS